jgi:hypothetical protein
MCLCCSAKARTIKRDILPGYDLLKGTVDVKDEWPIGWYALQHYNDPDFIWEPRVWTNPIKGLTDREINKNKYPKRWKAWKKWCEDAEKIEASLRTCGPETGYFFMKACKKAGYRKKDGRLSFWLMDKLAENLKRK